jgi:3-oxoacyl-[acyl-carrier-protein] synthase-3
MTRVSRIVGTGAYLPERVLTNDDLSKIVDTSDAWITERTGIKSRHIAAEGQTTSDLAYHAATKALEAAGMTAADIDLIVVATTTPDNTFPAAAVKVQQRLGMKRGAAFDIQAACSGFVFGLSVVDALIRTGGASNVLLIGAEVFSRILDWSDRTTCVLFGDGAGAVVLKGVDLKNGLAESQVMSTHIHSDGRYYDYLYTDGGPSSTATVGHIVMHGQAVFKQAVGKLAEVVEEALAANGLKTSEIDWFVPHQANRRIIEGTARKLGLEECKVVLTIDRHGNTSAASIPLALDEAARDGRIKPGHLVLMEAMGGGLTWGSGLIRW